MNDIDILVRKAEDLEALNRPEIRETLLASFADLPKNERHWILIDNEWTRVW